MISRMKHAARYMIPRQLKSLEFSGGWFATALRNDHASGEIGEDVLNRVDNEHNKCGLLRYGNYVLAADVTLYKREELLGRLNLESHDHSMTDAALIMESYLKWGTYCTKHLYGDYAFVIVHTKNGEIFCGRDPLGVRPLFYSLRNDCFVFASELRYVVQSFGRKPDIDEDYLLDTLVTVKSAKNLSPFENIYRLPPGHTLSCVNGRINLNPFWLPDSDRVIEKGKENEPELAMNQNRGKGADPALENQHEKNQHEKEHHEKNQHEKEQECIETLREKLVDAVNMRCNGAVTLGSELSGGLDSSTVAGIAAAFADSNKIPFKTYSNIFPDNADIEFKDEKEFIHQMLEFRKMEWTGIDRLKRTIPELLQFAMDVQGCFVQQNFNIFNQGIYEAAGRQGIDVLLSGFGGDEMVSARIAFPWNEIIGEGNWRVLTDELFYKGLSVRTLLRTGKIFSRYIYSRFQRSDYRTGVFTIELLRRRFTNLPLWPDFALSHGLKKRYEEKHKMPAKGRISARQLEKLKQDHLPQRLEYCYAAAAQYGLEYRYPLLDLNLVETYLSLPVWLRQRHGTNRYLFREAIKDFVPEGIRTRDDKSGTTIPQTYYSLIRGKDTIYSILNDASKSPYLNTIFDFSRFPDWYNKLVKREQKEMNYLMPGAFYHYLMLMLYYKYT